MLVKEARLYPEGNEKPLKGSKRGVMCVCDRINFEFLGDHSGCFVGN